MAWTIFQYWWMNMKKYIYERAASSILNGNQPRIPTSIWKSIFDSPVVLKPNMHSWFIGESALYPQAIWKSTMDSCLNKEIYLGFSPLRGNEHWISALILEKTSPQCHSWHICHGDWLRMTISAENNFQLKMNIIKKEYVLLGPLLEQTTQPKILRHAKVFLDYM